jgi:hypothetical protein
MPQETFPGCTLLPGGEGKYPSIDLVLHNGSLYRTAEFGGNDDAGLIFRLTL